jgi:hypothetical protein
MGERFAAMTQPLDSSFRWNDNSGKLPQSLPSASLRTCFAKEGDVDSFWKKDLFFIFLSEAKDE